MLPGLERLSRDSWLGDGIGITDATEKPLDISPFDPDWYCPIGHSSTFRLTSPDALDEVAADATHGVPPQHERLLAVTSVQPK